MTTPAKPLSETEASDTLKTHYSGAGAMAGVMGVMSTMKHDDQIDFFMKSLEKYNPEEFNKQKANLASIKSTDKVKMPMPKLKEDMDVIFAGTELTEETKDKLATLMESAVEARLIVLAQQMEDENEAEQEKVYAEMAEALEEKIDGYLSEAVDEWATENKIALEAGARSERLEEFVVGLQKLFAESYVELPEDKVDLVKDLETRLADVTKKLDEAIDSKVALEKTISEQKKTEIIKTVSEGLAATQVEKLTQLVEAFKSDDVEAFEKKAKLVRETYFKAPTQAPTSNEVPGVDVLNEEDNKTVVRSKNDPMNRYLTHMDRVAA